MTSMAELKRRVDGLQPPARPGQVRTLDQMTDAELTRIAFRDSPVGYVPTDSELERLIAAQRKEVRGLITMLAASKGEPLPSGPETEAAIDRILAGAKHERN